MPQANSHSSTSKRPRAQSAKQAVNVEKARNKLLPAIMRDKSPIGTVQCPPNIDPLSYGVNCIGNCLSPLIVDGDIAICSPSAKAMPGMIVAFTDKAGHQGVLKRLVSDLYGENKNGNCQQMIVVEMDNPPKRFCLDPSRIDKAHVVVGIVRRGEYIVITPG